MKETHKNDFALEILAIKPFYAESAEVFKTRIKG